MIQPFTFMIDNGRSVVANHRTAYAEGVRLSIRVQLGEDIFYGSDL